jgi:3D (Asp-Asp-Asp) domain-containing protein
VIKIRTKSNFLFIFIVIVLTTITIIGFMCCEHKFQRATELDNETTKRVIEENKRTIETKTDKDGDTNQAIEPVSLGNFKLTAYCSCSLCCGKWANNRPNGVVYGAIGEELKEGYSIAVDPTVIPYRTEVIINGHTYKTQDCGGAIKGNSIDVYFEDHNDALEFGVQYAEVYIK